DVTIGRIDRGLESVAAVLEADAIPVVLTNADTAARRAWTAPPVVILQTEVDVVRTVHVRRHEVREPGGHCAHVLPREPLVPAHPEPGIGTPQYVLRIRRIDPVRVLVDRLIAEAESFVDTDEGLSAVERLRRASVRDEDHFV